MPNHCESDLTITGPVEDIKKFLEASYILPEPDESGEIEKVDGARPDGSYLSLLRAHYPMPSSLNITAGSNTDMATAALFGTDRDVAYWTSMPWAPERGIVDRASLLAYIEKTDSKAMQEARIAKENVKNYGHKDWYSWALAEWGTKWGDYETTLVKSEPKKIKISFQTAWGPPAPGLTKIAAKWPTLKFDLRYYEQGMGFKGQLVLKGDEVLKEEQGKYSGRRGG